MFENLGRWLGVQRRNRKKTSRISDVEVTENGSDDFVDPNSVGLLIAAGKSSRFDPSGLQNKLLANLNGQPVITHSARNLASQVQNRIAVVRPGAKVLPEILADEGYWVVECPDAVSGMGHSIAWGVAEVMKRFEFTQLVIALADMPAVQPATIRKLLIEAKQTNAIVAPSYQGKRGNPVVFGPQHFEALSRLSGDRGAAQLMKSQPLELVEVDDAGILYDIDTPADLERLLS